MSDDLELACPECDWNIPCDQRVMSARLRELGMLKRASDADETLIAALFQAALPRQSCPECNHAGLMLREAADPFAGIMVQSKSCQRCGKQIPAERLEIFPNETLCAACKQQGDSGTDDPPQYCPRCGNVMVVKLVRGGITRYELLCPKCRR